jgi:hypothetical protein
MKRLIPVFALALLAPFIAEILFGATPLSRMVSLPPLILLYGGGAVSIRELARRAPRPWTAVVCLGAAYGLIEEGMVMQTLFSPDLFGAAACGLRFAGVNWVWAEGLLGYHAVWSIAIPIALTELCFPQRRREPWLGRRGLAAALACYALGAASIATVFRRIVTPNFRAPAISLTVTAIVAAALVVTAFARRPPVARLAKLSARVPTFWLATGALVAAGLWMQLFRLPQFWRAGMRPLLPMTLAACLAAGVYRLLHRWSRAEWTAADRLELTVGAIVGSSVCGALNIHEASRFDRYGQAICSIAVLAVLSLPAFSSRLTSPNSD